MSITGIGYPDYQDLPNWRGQVFSAGALAVTIASPATVAEYVTNFASVYMRAIITGGTGVKIELNWYTDSTLAVLVLTQDWQLSGAPNELSVFVPAVANYLVAKLTTTNAGTQNVNFTLAPTNVQVPANRYPGPVNANSAVSTPIAANGVLTAPCPRIAEGECWIHVNVAGHATTFTVVVNELDQTNAAFSTLFRFFSAGPPVNAAIRCGPNVVQLSITNTDAAAHNFDYYIGTIGQ